MSETTTPCWGSTPPSPSASQSAVTRKWNQASLYQHLSAAARPLTDALHASHSTGKGKLHHWRMDPRSHVWDLMRHSLTIPLWQSLSFDSCPGSAVCLWKSHHRETVPTDKLAEVGRLCKFLLVNEENPRDIHAHVPLESRSPFCGPSSIRNVWKHDFPTRCQTKGDFFSPLIIQTASFVTVHTDGPFLTSAQGLFFFNGRHSFYCSSLLGQWAASFDQMIKAHCSLYRICKTHVYWIYFIATLFLPRCAPSASHTRGSSPVCLPRFVVGAVTANWISVIVLSE